MRRMRGGRIRDSFGSLLYDVGGVLKHGGWVGCLTSRTCWAAKGGGVGAPAAARRSRGNKKERPSPCAG